jgi:dinuclear metal center YbgI/SA1388 family protein
MGAGSCIRVGDVAVAMERVAPLCLAAEWDNVGLLVGDRQSDCSRVMTCLTITESVVDEAVEKQADLIIAHHPLPFQSLKRITTDTVYGKYLWRLIGNCTAIYSAHTAFDSAESGINQQIAAGLGLRDIKPLEACAELPGLGAGRLGWLPQSMSAKELARFAGTITGAASVKLVGDRRTDVSRVAIGCGSGGSLLGAAVKAGCDAFVTGEANFHGCLEAEAHGVMLVLVGHYSSERFAMEWLAGHLQVEFPGCLVWASESESDPIRVL